MLTLPVPYMRSYVNRSYVLLFLLIHFYKIYDHIKDFGIYRYYLEKINQFDNKLLSVINIHFISIIIMVLFNEKNNFNDTS